MLHVLPACKWLHYLGKSGVRIVVNGPAMWVLSEGYSAQSVPRQLILIETLMN